MSLRRSMGSRRGATLIEVIVALGVIVIMSLLVWEALRNAIEFNDLLSMRDNQTRSARVALNKLRRELQLAYLTPNRAAIEQYETVFVGMDQDPDTIFFATLSHQRIYANSRESDQTEITVWADNVSREDGKGLVLFHREAPRIDEEPAEDGRVHPLAYDVRSFNLRYLNALTNEWADEWDTRSADTPYKLPRAVEVALVLIGPDPEDPDRTVDVPYLTTIQLVYADKLQRKILQGGALDELSQGGGLPR